MEYLDSTDGASGSALAARLAQEVAGEHARLRIKTGYFSLNALGALKGTIDHLVQNDLPITVAIGANDQTTIKADVDALFTLMSCPRAKVSLCVVTCTGGLFHPKVVHLTRTDGSQFAYVGSANVTPNGFNGANVEAGMIVDTRQGDPSAVLAQIADSIDILFIGAKPGVTIVKGPATTQKLVDDGVLGVTKPPPSASNQGASSASGGPVARMKRKPLVTIPPIVVPMPAAPTAGSPAPAAGTSPQPGATTGAKDILIAEIGGPTRWKQANFPLATMQTYFGINTVGGGFINLIPVDAKGTASAPVSTKFVKVKSQNYRFELSSVAGLAYPTGGRPIAVLRKTATNNFRYRVFMPGNPGYAPLSAGLAQRYAGPKRELRRVATTSADLQAIWSACPV